jgi:ketosteroid isomerase-like protein
VTSRQSAVGSRQDLAVVRRIFEVMDAEGVEGLIARFDELCTPDFTWIPATGQALSDAEHHGRQGLEDWWRAFSESFAEVHFEAGEHRAVTPGVVLTLGHTTAQGAGSGVPIEWDFSQLNKIRDGKAYWARSWASHEEGEEAANAAA